VPLARVSTIDEGLRVPDFHFTDDEVAFRDEVEAFLEAELPADVNPTASWTEEGNDDLARGFTDKLAKKGWLAPAWPVEYGGLGLSHMKQLIYNEAMAYHGAPLGQSWCGIQLVGPTLMVYGSEEQKKEHLGAILRNEVWWAQGFSEPNSGSDLASLQTRAVIDGDDFVVNGSKIWTSGAQYASKVILLTRTDPEAPKHKGISFLLVDIDSPGFRVQPLVDMSGNAPFNQMFFEDVRVPRRNMVGEMNRGWYMAATTLDFERSGVDRAAHLRRQLEEVVRSLRAERWNGRPALSVYEVRQKLTQLKIEIDVARWIAYQVASLQAQGKIPNYEASMSKLFASEVSQRFARSLMEIYGLHAQLRPEDRRTKLGGMAPTSYMVSVPATIAAGSSEIQRNIIATRGLGLPRI
jgi:alkylation response protein AidB-like acyl-CoA dehydrogenase